MAVCPRCSAGVGINADRCPRCGASLHLISEMSDSPIDALKEDIEDFVRETAPEDLAAAEEQIESWQATVGDGPREVVRTADEARPVRVYDAPDETSAHLIASLLESEGIDAIVEQHTTPGLDTAYQMEEGIWGQVYVHSKDLGLAREVIAAFESGTDESAEPEGPGEPGDESEGTADS